MILPYRDSNMPRGIADLNCWIILPGDGSVLGREIGRIEYQLAFLRRSDALGTWDSCKIETALHDGKCAMRD